MFLQFCAPLSLIANGPEIGTKMEETCRECACFVPAEQMMVFVVIAVVFVANVKNSIKSLRKLYDVH